MSDALDGYDPLDDDEEYDGDCCYNCGGFGWVITCIDDLCRGAGECMHGDGTSPCPVCNAKLQKDPC